MLSDKERQVVECFAAERAALAEAAQSPAAPATSITHAEIKALRKDAERYRWLRDDAFKQSDDCFFEAGRLFARHQGDSFDVAVDADMAKERQS